MLLHAYGWADDTPGHLAALAGGDPDARAAAQSHLWSAVIHQGTPWTVTPSAAVTVAGLVGDPRLDEALRADLLDFLAAVASAGRDDPSLRDLADPEGLDIDAALAAVDDPDDIFGDEVLGNAVYARALLGCHDVTPALLAAVRAALGDPSPLVRAAAANACTAAGADPAELAAPLDALAAGAGPDERAALVLAMDDPRPYLRDPHPGVRACAALSPSLAGDPAATAELLAALTDPAAADAWFTDRPPQLPMHIRFTLIAAVIARVADPALLLPAALAIAPSAGTSTVRHDWGPLLLALNGEPRRRYLAALVDNPALWDPANGSVGLVFREAGLPYDREACRELTAPSR